MWLGVGKPNGHFGQRRSVANFFALLLALAALGAGTTRPARAAEPGALANVRGVVWYDEVGDGRRAGSEPFASGAQIILSPDPGMPPIYANESGSFAFSVAEGVYTLEARWEGSAVTSRAPGADSGAYNLLTLRFDAGANQELSIGVRPTGRFPAQVDTKIEIVWPHDAQGRPRSVAEAPVVNISASLFYADTPVSVPCSYSPVVQLVAAIDDRPGQVVAVGNRQIVTVASRTFPTWEFDDVDVSAVWNPQGRVYFWLKTSDTLAPDTDSYAPPRFRSNVWAHALDGRTYSPKRSAPTETGQPEIVAGRVDVVWPHDDSGLPASVDQATLANVDAVLLDALQTKTSVGPAYAPPVWLLQSMNGGAARVVTGRRSLVTDGGAVYPRWTYNDIGVSEARDPANLYFFRLVVAGRDVLSNVWAHGVDGRTIAPARELPLSTALDCP